MFVALKCRTCCVLKGCFVVVSFSIASSLCLHNEKEELLEPMLTDVSVEGTCGQVSTCSIPKRLRN